MALIGLSPRVKSSRSQRMRQPRCRSYLIASSPLAVPTDSNPSGTPGTFCPNIDTGATGVCGGFQTSGYSTGINPARGRLRVLISFFLRCSLG